MTSPRPTERETYTGRTIAGKYLVEEMIGEGGMGRVYRARQVALDKPVVLKVLRKSLLSDSRTVARFHREAKAASRLNHPNSISVLDFGEVEDGSLYIAMELVTGEDLHQILSREWPLPEARVVRIALQVLSALSDAHRVGVIHRDLKPENIMIEQRRGEPDFVKVLDFGIAKIIEEGEDGPALTRTGFVCGTPEYMSPEQARGGALDPRSDLYSVGVILYQLMTGLLPFDSDSAVGFATQHLNDVPPAPSRRRPEAKISPGLEALILRVLAKNPAERPRDAEAFQGELLALESGRRLEAGRKLIPGPVPSGPLDSQPTQGADASEFPGDEPTRTVGSPRLTEPTAATVVAGRQGAPSSDRVKPLGGWGFKAVTLGMVGVAAVLAVRFMRHSEAGSGVEVYRPPPNAPLPGKAPPAPKPVVVAPVPVPAPWLYRAEGPTEEDRIEAERLASEGDQAFKRGQLADAAQMFERSFRALPEPDRSLKLGEIYFQMGNATKARGWWGRHLLDRPQSRARAYLTQRYPELGER